MNSQNQPIHGKVARVLNSREVAINKGMYDGVRVGMIFKILSTKGSEITDPDTGEALGSVELEKASVRVTEVKERIAVAATYRSQKVNVGGGGVPRMTLALFEPPKWEIRFETLRTDEDFAEELDEKDSFVHVGDSIVQDLKSVEADVVEKS